MKKAQFFLINIVFCLFPVFSNEINNIQLLEQYYKAEEIPRDEMIKRYLESKDNYLINLSENSLIEYIEACTLLSNLYSSGLIPEYQNTVEALFYEINSEVKNYYNSVNVLMAYADYLYSEFSWKKNVSDNIFVLPNLYRRIIFLNKNNEQALVKLAMWYISASNYSTSNWNSFITSQENKLESLTDTDKFNGYLLYSMFYMKKYNLKKAKLYLDKAKELYPNNPMLIVIEENYKKGKAGW